MADLTLRELQKEQTIWVRRNFPGRKNYHPLLGVVEELGELAHAHLKTEQSIRMGEDHRAKTEDAVGDLVIYLADYCSANDLDFQECVQKTWEEVKKRDWINNPNDADKKVREGVMNG